MNYLRRLLNLNRYCTYVGLASTALLITTLTACQPSSPPTANAPAPDETTSQTVPASPTSPAEGETIPTTESGAEKPEMQEVSSPAGGTTQKVYIPGPESAVAVTCDRQGFAPFIYEAEGETWVGCQTNGTEPPGPEVSQTVPEMREAPSPAGGTLQKVYIPGPESAVAVTCERPGFTPYFYEAEGETWVGCQQTTS